MKKSPFVLGLLVVGVGAVLYLLLADGDAGRATVQDRGSAAGASDPVGAAPDASSLLSAPTPDPSQETTATRVANNGKRIDAIELGDNDGFDTSTARWVDVTVRLPAGVPVDDEVALLALSSEPNDGFSEWEVRGLSDAIDLSDQFIEEFEDEDIEWSRRVISDSMTVRMPFHHESQAGAIVLVSRYVYAPTVIVDLNDETGPVTIDGKLGAYVTGRIVLPRGAEDRRLTRDDFELEFQGRSAKGGFNFEDARNVKLEEDLTYELRALSAENKYIVHAESEELVDFIELSFHPEAGKHTVFDVPLELGGTITGRVVGERGAPIADADVEATGKGRRSMFFGGSGHEAETDEAGRYSIRGVAAGRASVAASAEGWLSSDDIELEIADGQELTGIDFFLSSGNRITGSVVWPDGTAAAGAWVSASVQGRQGWRNRVVDENTDDDGNFVLTGLGDGPFELRAALALDESGEPVEVEHSDDFQALRGLGYVGDSDSPEDAAAPPHRASLSGVAPNTAGVVLNLVAPLAFSGRVVDDAGHPVTTFEISARPANGPKWGGSEAVDAHFTSDEGKFTLNGVFEGDWIVAAEAEGYSREDDDGVPIVVPTAGREVVLVLRRTVTVTGTVVDPSGAPIDDATVIARSGDPSGPFGRGSQARTDTDENGQFELEDCAPNGLSLVANHDAWASSEPIPLATDPGSTLADVVLVLRVGATITGEVFDDEGQPEAGRTVTANAGGNAGFFGGESQVVTDASGYFVLEHVEPGKVTVIATPQEDELFDTILSGEDDEDPEQAMMNLFGQMRMKSLEVADGEEVHIILGAEPKVPVRVVGTVTEAGEPKAEAAVLVIEEGGAILQGMKMTRTDASGRFEITVDRPGHFMFGIGDEAFGGSQTQFFVAVPEVDEFDLELAIPLGRISGTVIGPDGSPVSGVSVRLSEEGGVIGLADLDQSKSQVTSGDGAFVFERVHPGTYTVGTGGVANFFSPDSSRYGAVVIGGIELEEDATISDLEIRLGVSGKLTGTVRDASGATVAGASVFVRDSTGRVLSNISSCTTNGTGQFTYKGVPTGKIWAFVRSDELSSAEQGPIDIAENSETEVDFVVSPGCYLIVSLLLDGEPVRARVKVLDQEGRQVNGLFSQADLEELVMTGFSWKERRVGPLPPAKYTLIATAPDGAETKKSVTVREGRGERRVKLRLK